MDCYMDFNVDIFQYTDMDPDLYAFRYPDLDIDGNLYVHAERHVHDHANVDFDVDPNVHPNLFRDIYPDPDSNGYWNPNFDVDLQSNLND